MPEEAPTQQRGALIVLEGCDKSGKSTQCSRLVETLNASGITTEGWRYPERSTEIGKVIDAYISKRCELEDHAVHLLFSANRWESMPAMRKKLLSGTTLVVDRYAYSGVAFTAAKGYESAWLKSCDSGLIEPDAVLYMDIPIKEASTRGSDYGDERYEVSDFQQRAQQHFADLREPWWQTVDARRSLDDVHEEVRQIALAAVEAAKDQPLKKLWTDLTTCNVKAEKRKPAESGVDANVPEKQKKENGNILDSEKGKENIQVL